MIRTENGQTVQFQVLKHLFLSSAPWKTTKKTYISIIRQIWKKQPRKGVFFSPKCPRGTRTRILPRSVTVVLYLVQLPPHFDRVSEKNNGWIKCYEAKSVIFSHFRAFWGFFSHKRAPGDATRIIFKNPRMLHFPPYKVVTPCKISEKYNG